MVCVDAVLISGSVDNAVIIIGVDCGESDKEGEEKGEEEGEEDEDGCDDDNEESEDNDDCGELVSALGLDPIIGVDSLTEDN